MADIVISHTTPIVFGQALDVFVDRVELDLSNDRVRVLFHHKDPATGTVVKNDAIDLPLASLVPAGSPLLAPFSARVAAIVAAERKLAGAAVSAAMTPGTTAATAGQ